MRIETIAMAGLLGLAAVSLGGCGTVSKGVAANGESAEQLVFPPPSDAVLRGGTFPSIEQLRQVAPGMTKDQLYQMFGPPHFHEGVFGVREWDYLFNFRTGEHGQYVTCEFKVLFDTRDIARSYYWKPKSCVDLIKPVPVAAAAVPLPSKPITLATDMLFGFDKWQLTTAGEQMLDRLLGQIESASHVENIHVVGYTDRIGSDAYNLRLSGQRADSVRDYLVAHGVPAAAVSAEGRGKADPVAACNGVPSARLIICLAPNRRVEISGQLKPAG